MDERISELLLELKCELAKEYKQTGDTSCYWAALDSLNATANEVSHNSELADDSFELMDFAASSIQHFCPVCGGNILGDGFTIVRHCENVDISDVNVEPDSEILYCKTLIDILIADRSMNKLLYTKSEIGDQLENGVDNPVRPLEFFMELMDTINSCCEDDDLSTIKKLMEQWNT